MHDRDCLLSRACRAWPRRCQMSDHFAWLRPVSPGYCIKEQVHSYFFFYYFCNGVIDKIKGWNRKQFFLASELDTYISILKLFKCTHFFGTIFGGRFYRVKIYEGFKSILMILLYMLWLPLSWARTSQDWSCNLAGQRRIDFYQNEEMLDVELVCFLHANDA